MLSIFSFWLRLFNDHMRRMKRWFLLHLPQVKTSDRRVPLRGKVIYTVISLLIYLVCNELPLYGVLSVPPIRANPFDPIYWIWTRVMHSPNFGTVMDLGVIPVLFSRIVTRSFPVLIDTNILRNSVLLHANRKLIAIVVSFHCACCNVLCGKYGSLDQLGMGNAILIIFQLCFAVIIVIFLDELLQKGYGFGSGISLFSAANVCQNILWNAFYQQNHHNVTNLLATVLIFLIVIYLQGFCVLVPLRSRNDHEQQPSYPIKLFYTSYAPIWCLSAYVLVIRLFALVVEFNDDMLSKWKLSEFGGGPDYTLVGGIAYYTTSPSSLADMAADPFHALFYLVFVLSTSTVSSIVWTYWSFSNSLAVLIQLREQIESGYRRHAHNLLRQYIPPAAAFGGMFIGALTVLANMTGAFSSASGILLAVTTISEYLEAFEKEKAYWVI